jgi:hypothetical protein
MSQSSDTALYTKLAAGVATLYIGNALYKTWAEERKVDIFFPFWPTQMI